MKMDGLLVFGGVILVIALVVWGVHRYDRWQNRLRDERNEQRAKELDARWENERQRAEQQALIEEQEAAEREAERQRQLEEATRQLEQFQAMAERIVESVRKYERREKTARMAKTARTIRLRDRRSRLYPIAPNAAGVAARMREADQKWKTGTKTARKIVATFGPYRLSKWTKIGK
jgi:FtsZ-interacting cell division protein ZipA